jgi:hypothetical protein
VRSQFSSSVLVDKVQSRPGRHLVESGFGLSGERAKGQKMPEINAATGALTIPIWAVGAVAAVFLVLMMLAIAQAGTATVVRTLSRAVIVIAAACAGWLYVDNTNRQERAAARRAIDERSAALLARAMEPGSALSCLNGGSGETVEAACEKLVFATPETVSAAVSYATAELDLLVDGAAIYGGRLDQAYFSQLGKLQSILQRDRYGIVAQVLAARGCTADKCDSANVVGDPTRMMENLRDHVFDANVAKFAAAWNGGHGAAAANMADAPTARPAAAVSSQYDFPSADSIPPVNIMAPEPGSRNGTTAQAPSGVASRQATAPVPPRRPHPPVAASRPAAPRPAAPVAAGEAPAEGGGTPPSTQ